MCLCGNHPHRSNWRSRVQVKPARRPRAHQQTQKKPAHTYLCVCCLRTCASDLHAATRCECACATNNVCESQCNDKRPLNTYTHTHLLYRMLHMRRSRGATITRRWRARTHARPATLHIHTRIPYALVRVYNCVYKCSPATRCKRVVHLAGGGAGYDRGAFCVHTNTHTHTPRVG